MCGTFFSPDNCAFGESSGIVFRPSESSIGEAEPAYLPNLNSLSQMSLQWSGPALGPVVMLREGAPAPGSRVLSFQWVLCVCESECAD